MVELEKTFSEYTGNYLRLLIESYKEQIKHLRSELKQKDDIIFDLIKHIGWQNNEQVCQRSEESPAITNVLSSSELCTDKSEWVKAKQSISARKTFTSNAKPVVTKNRYSALSLSDNEWLKDNFCNSENGKDEEILTKDGDEIPKPTRRANVVTEKNPEKNTQSPFRKSSSNGRRSIAILGDSMIKDIKHWELTKACPNDKIYVKAFPGADIADMEHYVNPTMKRDPDVVIIHCGTNSLRNDDSAEQIASDITELAEKMRNESNEVLVSSLICRGEQRWLTTYYFLCVNSYTLVLLTTQI